jgi:hypothetical protein
MEARILVSPLSRVRPKADPRLSYRVLVVLDRAFSTLLGRPCVLQDEE